MQTFMPSSDPVKSARILDNARLNKQRLEGLQILQALTNPQHGYAHHPAVVMWRGHVTALACWYLSAICDECDRRGIADNAKTRAKIAAFADTAEAYSPLYPMPWWIGNQAFHRSHRQNLLFKSLKKFGVLDTDMTVKPSYVWPIHRDEYHITRDIGKHSLVVVGRYTKNKLFEGKLGRPDRRGHRLFTTHQTNGVPVIYLLEKP